MRGKKGSGHLEMIIGFVFFIGSVFFLFMYISPWDNSSLPNSALNNLYDSFEESVSVSMSSVFVNANSSANCFSMDLPTELFKYAITDESSRVTRLGGEGVASGLYSDGELNLNNPPGEDFFRVAISSEFTDANIGSCAVLTDFELGGVVELMVVSNKSLTAMRDRYYSDYTGLKSDLRVADIFDFAIIPEDMSDFVMEPASGIPDSVEILARDYVVKVLTSDGAVSNERISFRIW